MIIKVVEMRPASLSVLELALMQSSKMVAALPSL
jgi:hypothetical protein